MIWILGNEEGVGRRTSAYYYINGTTAFHYEPHTIDPPNRWKGRRQNVQTRWQRVKRWGQQVTTTMEEPSRVQATCHGISASELQWEERAGNW